MIDNYHVLDATQIIMRNELRRYNFA